MAMPVPVPPRWQVPLLRPEPACASSAQQQLELLRRRQQRVRLGLHPQQGGLQPRRAYLAPPPQPQPLLLRPCRCRLRIWCWLQ
jgi:hypothetical protein